MPEAAKPVAMLGLIERLDHVRAAGLDPARGHRVHQSRLAQLAREAGRTTVQHVAGYERQRRHATLVAVALDLAASLTDQAVDLFDRLIAAEPTSGMPAPSRPTAAPSTRRSISTPVSVPL